MRKMRHPERTEACFAHLAGMLPIWGALVMGWILWRNRERSRPVAFHAQQALFFHIAVLAIYPALWGLELAGRLAGVVRPDVGELLQAIARWLIVILFASNVLVVFRGASRVIDGRSFDYPFFGKRLRKQFETGP